MFFLTRKKKSLKRCIPYLSLERIPGQFFFSFPVSEKRSITEIFLIMWGVTSKTVAALAQFPVGAAASLSLHNSWISKLSNRGERDLSFHFVLRECFKFTSGILQMPYPSPEHCCVIWKCAERMSTRQILEKVDLTMEFNLEEFKLLFFGSLYHDFCECTLKGYMQFTPCMAFENMLCKLQICLKMISIIKRKEDVFMFYFFLIWWLVCYKPAVLNITVKVIEMQISLYSVKRKKDIWRGSLSLIFPFIVRILVEPQFC